MNQGNLKVLLIFSTLIPKSYELMARDQKLIQICI